MFSPFSWVRAAFKSAALAGIADALKELALDEDLQSAISDRVLPELTAPSEEQDEPVSAKKKTASK